MERCQGRMIDLSVGSMSKDELNLPEGLKMSLISRHTFDIFKKKERPCLPSIVN